jgi:DNA replication protein DnaC
VRKLPAKEAAKKLMLSYIANNHESLAKEAKETKVTHGEFLESILDKELEYRLQNRVQRKIGEARFPYRKYLQDLKLDEYDNETCGAIEDLASLDFIKAKQNAIFISNPGRGKTHLAIGLGIAACLADMRVLFTNVPNLVIELKEAMSKNQVTAYKRKFARYELVVIDELGYVSFDKQGNEILFNLLSNRNETGSMIVTTNLAFEKWEEVFHDTNLTGALVDRLTYKAHILDMNGPSYRLKETKELIGK